MTEAGLHTRFEEECMCSSVISARRLQDFKSDRPFPVWRGRFGCRLRKRHLVSTGMSEVNEQSGQNSGSRCFLRRSAVPNAEKSSSRTFRESFPSGMMTCGSGIGKRFFMVSATALHRERPPLPGHGSGFPAELLVEVARI